MKQKIQLTFEKVETFRVVNGRPFATEFCGLCQSVVQMATPYAVSAASGVAEREIFRLIEAGKVHFVEAGRVLICLNSLPNSTRECE